MLKPASPWIVAVSLASGLWLLAALQGAPAGDAALHPLMDVFRVAAAGLVVVTLRRSWGRADSEGITRLTWLLVALASLIGILLLYIGGNVLVGVTDWPEPNVAWRPLLVDAGVLGFLVALAMSILSRGRIDARPLAKRILASSAVATLGLFLAAALEALFAGGILAAFSLRTGVGTVLAFAAMVATHRALIRFVERLLDQLHIPEPG
jgi:hypothetical protein